MSTLFKERLRASASGGGSSKDGGASPFVQTSHSHPAFSPQKLGTKGFQVIQSGIIMACVVWLGGNNGCFLTFSGGQNA